MNGNKQIISYCPNYYDIINFNPIEGDELTGKIIDIYRSYIFRSNDLTQEEVNTLRELDTAIAKYLNDYSFRGEVQKEIVNLKVKKDCKDIIKFFIDAILRLFTNYENFTSRVITVSRWI